MLLYQWLLANKDAGGAEQRQKHVNLLVAGNQGAHQLSIGILRALYLCPGSIEKSPFALFAGAGQLFWSDVHSSLIHFQPLYTFMANEVVLCSDRRRLDTLPPQSRAKLLSVVAAFLPYYTPSAVRFPATLWGVIPGSERGVGRFSVIHFFPCKHASMTACGHSTEACGSIVTSCEAGIGPGFGELPFAWAHSRGWWACGLGGCRLCNWRRL